MLPTSSLLDKILPTSIAVTGTIIILSITIFFHFLVIAGIIPFHIVWGGNLADRAELYTMETISIIINIFMLFIILLYSGGIKVRINRKIVIGAIWFMFAIFVLNTIGNLLAKSAVETYIFTPLTLILALFCFRMAAFER